MTRLVRPLDDNWMAYQLDTSTPSMSETPLQQLEFSMTQWLQIIRWCDNTSRGSCSDSMTLWLTDKQLDTLQPEVSASAQKLDNDVMIGCHNDKMTEQATMQIGR